MTSSSEQQPPPAPPPRRAHAVPAGWAAANPADDDEPAPEPPITAVTARATPRPRGGPRPADSRPPTASPSYPTVAPPASPRRARPAGPDLTGKPRVDWTAYDAQAAIDHATDPVWVLYRAWTTVPVDGRWWVRAGEHVLAWLLGPRRRLLWIGISMRAGIARAAEHLADKHWRRQIHVFEVDQAVTFATEADAEAYEEQRIRAECPVYNTMHNDRAHNPGAVHRTKRIQAHHVADWRSQAAVLALTWVAVTAVCTWLLMPDHPGFAAAGRAIGAAVMLAATLLQALRIAALFARGHRLTTAQRNRIKAKIVQRSTRKDRT